MSDPATRYELGAEVAQLSSSRIVEGVARATGAPVFVQTLARSDEELAAIAEALEKGARALSDAGVPGRPVEWDVTSPPGWIVYDHHGEPLAAAVRRGRDPALVDAVAIETATALDILSKVGLAHRAINPRTLFHQNRRIAVLGLDALRASYAATRGGGGEPLNDPRFTAPEAFGGGGDIKADVYSLGCVLFALMTGAPPYFGSAQVLREAHQTEPIPTVPGEDAVGWNDLLRRMLAKAPGARPQPGEIAALVRKARQRSYASMPVAASVARAKGKSRSPIVAILGAALVLVALAGIGAARALAPADLGTPAAPAASAAPTGPGAAATAPVAGVSSTPDPAASPAEEATPEPTTAPGATARATVATPRRTVAPTPAPTAAPILQVAPAAGPRGTIFRFAVGGLAPGAVFSQSYSNTSGFQSNPIPSGVVGQDGIARTTLGTNQSMTPGPYAMRITAGGVSRVVVFQLTP